MFWPLVLPFQITVVLMIALLFGAIWLGIRKKWHSSSTTIAAFCLPPLMFIPSCVGTSYIVDYFRFGTFQYADFESIQDFRIERYMPPSATDITVFKHFSGNGYRARFTITQQDFDAWHNGMWERHGEHSVMKLPEDDGTVASDPGSFQRWFGEFNWSLPRDSVEYQGPVAGNGAHYTIDYSPSEQVAFLRSCN